jgi:hypothetical protein
MRFFHLLLGGLVWMVVSGAAFGQTAHPIPANQKPAEDKSDGSGWHAVFSPGSDIYPRYIADPLRPMISLQRAWVTDKEIPDTGDTRFIFRLGGRYGFLRVYAGDNAERGFQLDLGGAFLGVFDSENSLDNIGWDGLYEVLVSWGSGAGFAVQGGVKHISSHVGDEYAERTGRSRINYTREEFVLGLSQRVFDYWRIYTEAGYAYDLRNEHLQDYWRVQGGLEVENDSLFFNGTGGYYAALNVTAYEESDWKPDTTVQAGLVFPVKRLARNYRIGLEYRSGRSVIGEFFQSRETTFSIGLWMDL